MAVNGELVLLQEVAVQNVSAQVVDVLPHADSVLTHTLWQLTQHTLLHRVIGLGQVAFQLGHDPHTVEVALAFG